MASEVQLDALPYVDQGYDEPGVREAAMQLVDEETRRYRPTKNYLDFLQPPKSTFETDILRSEFERLAARQPMELLSSPRSPTIGTVSSERTTNLSRRALIWRKKRWNLD
ncbi:Pre-mRNA-splicing factor SPF27 [Geodia barretti]|uniref:Pre-mRNA-splicing factor SPF27 n=1 Tax=Geodia barretti TaxID=519541 RepID=A0AA35RBW7_GEOBA|nr:Pre-mRNA-splicing factor SPF27 [Geodia barretti]